jgi:hypothetical protein
MAGRKAGWSREAAADERGGLAAVRGVGDLETSIPNLE